jgi:hypothetical protein
MSGHAGPRVAGDRAEGGHGPCWRRRPAYVTNYGSDTVTPVNLATSAAGTDRGRARPDDVAIVGG